MEYRNTYTNKALTAVCEAVEEWDLTPAEIASLVADLPGELDARAKLRDGDDKGE